eukprot:CAMPEP_0178387710 /NCGR_PEP_ID=MMETSP0689_2-20121128/9213_1 /TAXON_ID=160604 /ORGANISM="Amphidinium massartii, Strain CS-259" /LENGTH=583 /DNA_ID=CAMNT_0020008081 /DNA_START=66 /DNA_END=1817 /DNA_ORIENTATION=+
MAEPAKDMMTIQVTMLATGSEVCCVSVPQTAKVMDLRKEIAGMTKKAMVQQTLIVGDTPLDDNDAPLAPLLADAKIEDGPAETEQGEEGPEPVKYQVHLVVKAGEVLLEEVIAHRKLLSNQDPPIQQAIESVAKYLAYLAEDTWPKLQFEAAWALTNMAAGSTEQTRALVDAGAVDGFIRILRSENQDVALQAVWALGNIAGDSAALRDRVVAAGGMQEIISIFCPDEPYVAGALPWDCQLPQNVAWTLSNMVRGRPQIALEAIQPLLPLLPKLLRLTREDDLIDICWACAHISDGPNERAHVIVELGCVPMLVNHLDNTSNSVRVPALRALGNLASSNDVDTQAVLDAGFLSRVSVLMEDTKASIRKETCWTVSNIMAGTIPQIAAAMDAGMLQLMRKVLRSEDPVNRADVKKEAALALFNPLTDSAACTPEGTALILRAVAAGVLDDALYILEKDADGDDAGIANAERFVIPACIDAMENALSSTEGILRQQLPGEAADFEVCQEFVKKHGEKSPLEAIKSHLLDHDAAAILQKCRAHFEHAQRNSTDRIDTLMALLGLDPEGSQPETSVEDAEAEAEEAG